MLPTPENYALFPSVVQANVQTEMTVVPREKAFLFTENKEYELTFIAVDADETKYRSNETPETHVKMTVTSHNGVLRFPYTFPDEQEHTVILSCDEVKLQTFTAFSLYEDLYRLRPMKGDFHGHSYRSDGKRDPAALAGHYREQGYDFFSLTDHNRYYPGEEVDETYRGVKMAFFRVPGEEVHAPEIPIHIVRIGEGKSVTAEYVHDFESYTRETEEYLARVPADIPQKYTERYAKVMWATDKIHAAGGIAIFPHPYWRPGKSKIHNVCDELAIILLKSGMFDAYELIGGMGQEGNNRSLALWGEMRAEGLKIPVVGSSDVHKIEKAHEFPHLFSICFAEEATAEATVAAVKAGWSVAVEGTGTEYEREHRVYGSLRLVTYAQFLLRHFFAKMQRIAHGEGVAMRAYAIGEAPKELIELQAEQAEQFRAQFFGRKEPILPTSEALDFEEKWREVQRNGPQTKGSSIMTPPVNFQI